MPSKGVNKAIVLGNVGQDPEVRYTQAGTAVANLSVATSEQWKDKNTGEKQERTEWHRLVFWNRLAEVVGVYVGKGSKVYVEGKLQTKKWQDQQGNDRYSTEIVASELQMLDSRGQGQGGGQSAPQQDQGDQQQGGAASGEDAWDDDIPFLTSSLGPLGI